MHQTKLRGTWSFFVLNVRINPIEHFKKSNSYIIQIEHFKKSNSYIIQTDHKAFSNLKKNNNNNIHFSSSV